MYPSSPFSVKEYYLWSKNTHNRFPWKRCFLNIEFLKYEKERMLKLNNWRLKFLKSKDNQELDEAYFYTIPINLSSNWQAAIAELGNYTYIGLSALQNSHQTVFIALIPQDSKLPEEYKLIRIIKSKRLNLLNKKENFVEPTVNIESWEPLKSDNLYIDVPHEKRYIQKIFSNTLGKEDNVSLSLQSPLLSSPFVKGAVGGISLASLSGNASTSQELLKLILKMTPPEYRGVPPPEKAFLGGKYEHLPGITFHFAERPYNDNNHVANVNDYSYEAVQNELNNRNNFGGEYSIYSTINVGQSTSAHIWKQMVGNFTDNEIALPNLIDNVLDWDTDLTRLDKEINEDLWLQIVNSRQFQPGLDSEKQQFLNKTLLNLKNDFDVILSDTQKDDSARDILVKGMLFKTQGNLKRLAQSFSRADNRANLEEKDFVKAKGLIVDNFHGFLGSQEFGRLKGVMERRLENKRFEVIQNHLTSNPKSTTNQIFESIKGTGAFDDIYDLQRFLLWLHQKGHIIQDINRAYTWI